MILDDNQFERLFREQYPALCRTAYRLLQDAALAEDIVQDVFARLWKNRGRLDVRESYPAYLYRATLHQSLNYIKSHNRTLSREARYMKSIYPSGSTSRDATEDDLRGSELQNIINRAIDRLPPVCREVFILSRYENLSYKQIASALSISVNTVEKHMVKALAALRKAIANY